MTEAELLESAQAVWANYLTSMGLVVTVLSAYLVTAYIAGDKLTRPQVVLVNVLFVVFAGFGIGGLVGFSRTGTELMVLALEASTQRTAIGLTIVPEATLIIFPALILGCFKFMWDIRNSKTD
jgi:hypothetical protein